MRQLHHIGDDTGRRARACARRDGRPRRDRVAATPCSRARLVISAAKGAADRTMSTASASARPRVSRKPSRRCSRWLRAWTSHARRMSAGSTRRPSNGLLPVTTTWSARIAPNSSGNASSERPNSFAASRSGVASPASCHRCHAGRAGREIAARQRLHDRQRLRGRCLDVRAVMRGRAGRRRRVKPIRDERLQAAAKNLAQPTLQDRHAIANIGHEVHCTVRFSFSCPSGPRDEPAERRVRRIYATNHGDGAPGRPSADSGMKDA